jgi:serine/threonine protein kinase
VYYLDETLESLGRGNFGHVYKVKDLRGKILAIKVLNTKFKDKKKQDEVSKAIQREFDLGFIKKVDSPFLVKYHLIFPVITFFFNFFFLYM